VSKEDVSKLFSSIEVDFYFLPPVYYSGGYPDLVDNVTEKVMGAPSEVLMFTFHPENKLTEKREARNEFSSLVHGAFNLVDVAGYFVYDTQLVTPGYPGRLGAFSVAQVPISVLKGKRVVVYTDGALSELDGRLDKLTELAQKQGVTIEYRTADGGKPAADAFAILHTFKPNHAGAFSAFSHLFSKDQGVMKQFRKEVEPLLQAMALADDEETRLKALQILHVMILRGNWAVPFAASRSVILHSDRLDMSRFSPFDLRQHYYELRRK
jgi:hypothetical protein